MKRMVITFVCFFYCSILLAADARVTNSIPYFVYTLTPNKAGVSNVRYANLSLISSDGIKQMDEKIIAETIKKVKAAVCGANEKVDAKVWMSFGANGEIGIGAKISSSIQSGFEITFHC